MQPLLQTLNENLGKTPDEIVALIGDPLSKLVCLQDMANSLDLVGRQVQWYNSDTQRWDSGRTQPYEDDDGYSIITDSDCLDNSMRHWWCVAYERRFDVCPPISSTR